MEFSDDLAKKFKRKMDVIKDGAIRRAVLTGELAELEVETLATVLGAIIERAGAGSVAYKDMLHSLGDFSELINRAGQEKIDEVYSYFVRNGHSEPATLLRRIPPKKHADDHPEEVYIDRELKDVALGVRKSMGRTGGRDLVNRLLHDQDPAVVEQILANPGLTEDQIIKIAAKRPTSNEVLRKISRSQRWIKRYRVKKALVFNPYTPTEVAINLIRLLMKQDILRVAQDQALHYELRITAKKLLENEKSDELSQ